MITIDSKENAVVLTNTKTGAVNYPKYQQMLKIVDIPYVIYGISNELENMEMNPTYAIKKSYTKAERSKAYSAIADVLGTSCSNFVKMFNGAMYKTFIAPMERMHNRLAVKGTGGSTNSPIRDASMVILIHNNRHIIKSYLADNNDHLAGFGLFLGDAQSAKRILGKGLWKRLNRNSMTRNDLIVKHTLQAVTNPETNNYDSYKEAISALNDVPSTLLVTLNKYSAMVAALHTMRISGYTDLIKNAIKHINKPLGKISAEEIDTITHQVRDAHRMLRGRFNTQWSISRIHLEHQEAIRAEMIRTQPDNPFPYVDLVPNTIKENGFVFELCKNGVEVSMLGADQHHCVGSYSSECYNNRY